MSSDNEDGRPEWKEEIAAKLMGSTVLIGITRLGPDGPKQEQMFGVVISANSRRGFEIELGGVSIWRDLPLAT